MKTRRAAVVLLLVASAALTFAGRKHATAPELYAEARLAFDRADMKEAVALGKEGQGRFGDDPRWGEMFGSVVVDGLARLDPDEAQQELKRLPDSHDPEATVRHIMAAGFITRDAALYDKAYRLAERSVPSLRAEILVRRAGSSFGANDWDGVERYASDALRLVDRAREPYVFANAHGMIAMAHMRRGNYQAAIEQYDRSMQFAKVAGAKGTLSKMLTNYGWCFMQLGDAEAARVAYEKGLAIVHEQHDVYVEPTVLGNLSTIDVMQGRFEEAKRLAQQSVDMARKWPTPGLVAQALTNLAHAQIEMGEYDAARGANDEALKLFEPTPDAEARSYARLNAARIDAATGARDSAIVTLSSLEHTDDLPLRWNVQDAMARIYQSEGDQRNAERMYEAALDTGDVAIVKNGADTSDSYLFAFESNLIRNYDAYIAFLLARHRPLDALLVAERSRARTLFRGRERPPFRPVELARTHNATILCYWLAPQRSLVWVVTPDGVSVVPLPPAGSVEGLIDGYRDAIMSRADGLRDDRAARLFQILVAPALPFAASKRFIVIPDGRLSTISLETLVIPSPAPHYWIEDATISYAPALALIPTTSKHRPFAESWALLIGNVPAQGFDYPALPYAGDEIKHIAEYFGDHCRTLTGDHATPDAYLNAADLGRVSYMHFATHATANVRMPLTSSLILSRGGKLSGEQISKASLPAAELVTLSSCSSAGRRSYAGEGPVGLAWAFLRAGARRVVASQWDVSDAATLNVMDGMYGALADDSPPAVALRQAKLNLLHSGQKNARPYYWAPFILYGAP